jgi:pimeloyl-ACP methyl ester carboxylesterase
MGGQDPDFPGPAAEASWITDRLHTEMVMVPGAGRYPQSQCPELASEAVLDFLKALDGRA